MNRVESASSVARLRTPAGLSLYDTVFQRLAQDLQDLASKLGSLIQEAHPLVRQRHLLAAARGSRRSGRLRS